MHHQTLDTNWVIRPTKTVQQGNYPPREDGGWHAVSVPSQWQQLPALANYAGRVVYACHFTHNASPATRVWLRFDGIFYSAQAYLNGTPLAHHQGYCIPYEQDITTSINHENELFVEVDCPHERYQHNKQLLTGVFSDWDCMPPHSNPGGIWQPVTLHHSGSVRIHAVRCHTETVTERVAQLSFAVDYNALHDTTATLRWTIQLVTSDTNQVVEQQRTLHSGTQTIGGMLKLRQPHLWWTHDMGTPHLYTITLDIVTPESTDSSDSHTITFGVRQIELRDWIVHLNGERLLLKGANYMPDRYIATMSNDDYANDITLARASHMNFLRVYAHIQHPAFYEEANRAGMLLWQDMPLHRLYHARILPEARRQIKAIIRLLANHPSIAIWCMHNEPFVVDPTTASSHTQQRAGIVQTIKRVRAVFSQRGFSWNRDVMDTQLHHIAQQEDTHRVVVRSSGEIPMPFIRRGTDTHVPLGWHIHNETVRSFTNVAQYSRRAKRHVRFVTQFGAPSFPHDESCREWLPTNTDDTTAMAHAATHHCVQPAMMHQWLARHTALSLHETIAMSQRHQADIIRFYIDYLRYHKYRPTGGIALFSFNDAYPAITCSVLAYRRVPKEAYHVVRSAYSPQYAFTRLTPRVYKVAEQLDLPLYAVNDSHTRVAQMQLHARLSDPDGDELATVHHTISLEADCTAQTIDLLRLTVTQAGTYTLAISLLGGDAPLAHEYCIVVEY